MSKFMNKLRALSRFTFSAIGGDKALCYIRDFDRRKFMAGRTSSIAAAAVINGAAWGVGTALMAKRGKAAGYTTFKDMSKANDRGCRDLLLLRKNKETEFAKGTIATIVGVWLLEVAALRVVEAWDRHKTVRGAHHNQG